MVRFAVSAPSKGRDENRWRSTSGWWTCSSIRHQATARSAAARKNPTMAGSPKPRSGPSVSAYRRQNTARPIVTSPGQSTRRDTVGSSDSGVAARTTR